MGVDDDDDDEEAELATYPTTGAMLTVLRETEAEGGVHVDADEGDVMTIVVAGDVDEEEDEDDDSSGDDIIVSVQSWHG
jgi:hypothetical protein